MAKRSLPDSKAKILWIEGRRVTNPSFVPVLRKKGFEVEKVSTGKAALERVVKEDHDLVVVDAASMRTSGKRICTALKERVNGLPIMLIADSETDVAARRQHANVVLNLPFTARKLINRMRPLLPDDEDSMLKAGPIWLDLDSRQVRCHGKKSALTPRMVRLLRMLIDHKGEVVDREELFKKVWRTDYTGDTRTLDVHISWLRRALEKNPRKPQLLKTIRGVGYRLDV